VGGDEASIVDVCMCLSVHVTSEHMQTRLFFRKECRALPSGLSL
jgi:hypothetical protein